MNALPVQEDGDKLLPTIHSTSRRKTISNFCKKLGMELSVEEAIQGELTPVFLDPLLTNFGVDFLWRLSSSLFQNHGHKKIDGEMVDPYDKDFSDLFSQANMDRHRDRIAFVRSYREFERGMSVNLVLRTGKGAKLSNVTNSMAESRRGQSNAVAGDISGFTILVLIRLEILDSGQKQVEFEPLPTLRLKSS